VQQDDRFSASGVDVVVGDDPELGRAVLDLGHRRLHLGVEDDDGPGFGHDSEMAVRRVLRRGSRAE
jgi:hypothetical protein